MSFVDIFPTIDEDPVAEERQHVAPRKNKLAKDAPVPSAGQLHSLPTLRTDGATQRRENVRQSSINDQHAPAVPSQPLSTAAEPGSQSSLTLVYKDPNEEARFHFYFYSDYRTPLASCVITAFLVSLVIVFVAQPRTINALEPNFHLIGLGLVCVVAHLAGSVYFLDKWKSNSHDNSNFVGEEEEDVEVTDCELDAPERFALTTTAKAMPSSPWVSDSIHVSVQELVLIAVISSVFLAFIGVIHGKSENRCDSADDKTSCAKYIRADGALCIVYMSVAAVYRLRAVVAVLLTSSWTLVFVAYIRTPVVPTTTLSYKNVFSILFVALNIVTAATSFKTDTNARKHYWGLVMLKDKRRKAKALEIFYASIAGSMLPESVARRMAKEEVVRDQVQNAVVCCVGLRCTASIAATEGPAAMLMAMQRHVLTVDSALRIVAKACRRQHRGAAASAATVTKYHTFGDAALVCIRAPAERAQAKALVHLLLCVLQNGAANRAVQTSSSTAPQDASSDIVCALDMGNVMEVTFHRVKNFVLIGEPVDRVAMAMERQCASGGPTSSRPVPRVSVSHQVMRLLEPAMRGAEHVSMPLCDLYRLHRQFVDIPDEGNKPQRCLLVEFVLEHDTPAGVSNARDVLGYGGGRGNQQQVQSPVTVLRASHLRDVYRQPQANWGQSNQALPTARSQSRSTDDVNPLCPPVPSSSLRGGGSSSGSGGWAVATSGHTPSTGSTKLHRNHTSIRKRELVPVAGRWLPLCRFELPDVEGDYQEWRKMQDCKSVELSFAACLIVSIALVLSCTVEQEFLGPPILFSAGTAAVAVVGLITAPFGRNIVVLICALEGLYYVAYLFVFVLAPAQLVTSSDVRFWVSMILLLSALRDRAIAGALWIPTLVDVLITVPFLLYEVYNPRTDDSRLQRWSVSVGTLLMCILFRWFSDRSRRERYRTEMALLDVQQQLVRDSTDLAELLNKMVPGASRGQLFAKLLQAIRVHDGNATQREGFSDAPPQDVPGGQSVAHVALAHCPRLFGIRGSLFATRVQDSPLLLITSRHVGWAPPTSIVEWNRSSEGCNRRAVNVIDRDVLMQRISAALDFSSNVTIVKTNGDVVMIADESCRSTTDMATSLLDVVARIGSDNSVGFELGDSSSDAAGRPMQPRRRLADPLRCVLTCGPTMGGVLGTSSLSYEHYGQPVITAQRLLKEDLEDSGVWGNPSNGSLAVVALERYCELIQWTVIDHAGGSFADKAAMSEAMRSGFEMAVVTGANSSVDDAAVGDAPNTTECMTRVSFGPIRCIKVKGLYDAPCIRRIAVHRAEMQQVSSNGEQCTRADETELENQRPQYIHAPPGRLLR